MTATSVGEDEERPVWRMVSRSRDLLRWVGGAGRAGDRFVPSHESGSRRPGRLPYPGQRIRLVGTAPGPGPIPPGTVATVGVDVTRLGPGTFQVDVEWDNGDSRPLTELDDWVTIDADSPQPDDKLR